MEYDGKMDPQCVNLCNALNKFRGIETTESCCGHGKSKFTIFFKASDIKELSRVL